MTRTASSLNDLADGQWVAWFQDRAWNTTHVTPELLTPEAWELADFGAGHVVILSELPVETIEVPRAEYEAFVEQLATNGRSPASIVSYVLESGRAMVAATEAFTDARAVIDRTAAEEVATADAIERAVARSFSEQVAEAAVDEPAEPAEPAVKGDA